LRHTAAYILIAGLMTGARASGQTPIPTTIDNYFLRGTQPGGLTQNITPHTTCNSCHNVNGGDIVRHWQGSIMAQAGRDPLFYACLDIADHVAPGSGDLCIRCHLPKAWLEGRSTPTSGANLTLADRDSVNCNFCHRQVDPLNRPGEPAGDADIIAALLDGPPPAPGNGSFVVDPADVRRGPFTDVNCGPYHAFAVSPFFQRADVCGTCHDVSNPVFTRQPDETYTLNPTSQPHVSQNKYEMRHVERTFSEWQNSAYAIPPGVDAGGRFGGPGQTFVSTCQDCHMPDISGPGCNNGASRPDMPRHHLNGASTWVLDAIVQQYGPSTGSGELSSTVVAAIAEAKARNLDLLQRAATLEATVQPDPSTLRVRVINETGHKLPSGYPEGRRMWVNVRFRDCFGALLAERGYYDYSTADLTAQDTKVYEVINGIDEAVAAATGLPVGHSFYFVLNNVTLRDNRIPPRGYDFDAFAAVQAEHVDCYYADGQYWDDTNYSIPGHAVTAEVELYYQTASKEYIEFLRDANPNPPPNRGTQLYDLWLAAGKGRPVLMAMSGPVSTLLAGDINGDRVRDSADLAAFIDVLLGRDTDPRRRCAADLNGSGAPDGNDVQPFVALMQSP